MDTDTKPDVWWVLHHDDLLHALERCARQEVTPNEMYALLYEHTTSEHGGTDDRPEAPADHPEPAARPGTPAHTAERATAPADEPIRMTIGGIIIVILIVILILWLFNH